MAATTALRIRTTLIRCSLLRLYADRLDRPAESGQRFLEVACKLLGRVEYRRGAELFQLRLDVRRQRLPELGLEARRYRARRAGGCQHPEETGEQRVLRQAFENGRHFGQRLETRRAENREHLDLSGLDDGKQAYVRREIQLDAIVGQVADRHGHRRAVRNVQHADAVLEAEHFAYEVEAAAG